LQAGQIPERQAGGHHHLILDHLRNLVGSLEQQFDYYIFVFFYLNDLDHLAPGEGASEPAFARSTGETVY
jgi:hypothetical protein